jgi:hypothetical protein
MVKTDRLIGRCLPGLGPVGQMASIALAGSVPD